MGKRGPKPQGRVKTLVSLTPSQLYRLRLIAGHLAAKNGTRIDVSGVLRLAIDYSELLRRLFTEAAETLRTASKTPQGSRVIGVTGLMQDDLGRPGDEIDMRELFENVTRGSAVPSRSFEELKKRAFPTTEQQPAAAKKRKGAKRS
jgi:hypothetical protein